MRGIVVFIFGMSLLTYGTTGQAADGQEILQAQCASCHALTKPSEFSLQRLWDRKGPDLYYAGRKFNKAWLLQWLQTPTRIRPAGEAYFKHIKAGPERDLVDEATLATHLQLAKPDADAVMEALLALTGPPELVDKGAFKNEPVNLTVGGMFFTKLRGCAACHMGKPGEGGVSGPELYSAAQRLQPDYIYSYIKDPQRFDPYIWMPKLGLAEQDLQRLTGYLVQLPPSEETK